MNLEGTFASMNKAGGEVSDEIISTGEENNQEVAKLQRDHKVVEINDDNRDKIPSLSPVPVTHLHTPSILSISDNSWTPSNTTPMTLVFDDCDSTWSIIKMCVKMYEIDLESLFISPF